MFVVVSASAIPEHLHGYLSRFLSEVSTGLYVGNLSPGVRDHLWGRCDEAVKEGAVTMICGAPKHEQGFELRTSGPQRRPIVELDGVQLATTAAPKDAQNRPTSR
ncbi:type I-E CRISPR-associated endoribonuclease Cas2e [Rothia halotolerans]|uniref:type I-E CRISPR-associated endoribonuclease Cas2e n=1 Tax=Rothia halotolerans TaxID=405770 RepID=UPI00101B9288|nr:type I-E CRISPR-associated endoribonuclease Cas2e [Rothia halotolerans]